MRKKNYTRPCTDLQLVLFQFSVHNSLICETNIRKLWTHALENHWFTVLMTLDYHINFYINPDNSWQICSNRVQKNSIFMCNVLHIWEYFMHSIHSVSNVQNKEHSVCKTNSNKAVKPKIKKKSLMKYKLAPSIGSHLHYKNLLIG